MFRGSSPLARGTPLMEWFIFVSFGLIPARAGNTDVVGGEAHWVRAHPRSRGEHLAADLRPDAQAGSSPLARGTRH